MKIISLIAPKTAGATILTSNLAITHQWRTPQQRVGLLQLTQFPDIHHYMGLARKRNFGDLISFWKTSEWGETLIEQIVETQGVEVIQAPAFSQWSDISPDFFTGFLTLLGKRYQTLYLDYNPHLPPQVLQILLPYISHNICVLSMDPASFHNTKEFLEMSAELKEKSQIIINQTKTAERSDIQRQFKNLQIPLLGIIPIETKSLWHQIYEGVPAVMQKRSKFAKRLEPIIDQILKLQ